MSDIFNPADLDWYKDLNRDPYWYHMREIKRKWAKKKAKRMEPVFTADKVNEKRRLN